MYYEMKRFETVLLGLKQYWREFLGIGSQKYKRKKYIIYLKIIIE